MFKKAFSILFTGVASRFIVIASTPIVAGIVGPTVFGELTSLIAYMTFISPLLTLRLCVLLPQINDFERYYYFRLISVIIIGLTVALFLITCFFESFSPLPVLGAAFLAFYQTSYLMALKKGVYKRLNILAVLQTILGAGGKVLCAKFGGGVPLLMLFHIVQNSISFPLLISDNMKQLNKKKLGGADVLHFIDSNKKLIYQRVPAQILLGLTALIPIAFINYNFGEKFVGYWGLAYALIMLPLSVVTSSVSQVFWIEISSLKSELNKLLTLTIKVAGVGIILSIIIYLIFILFGTQIFYLFFDEQWELSISIIKILLMLLPCYLSGSHLVHVLTVLDKHNYFQILNTFRFIFLVLLCIAVHILEMDILQFVNGFVLVMYIYFFINIYMVYKGLKYED